MGKTGFLRPFEPPPTFQNLHAACRVEGAWIQINASARALVFSFYGVTRSSMCAVSARTTNDYLEMLFEIAASFGPVPIIIGGDFQSDPISFKAVQEAVSTGDWHDPLVGYDEEGLPSRPTTFHTSREQLDIGSSSIDGLLMNTTAVMCLDSVVDFQNKCHLPVHATFKWSRLHQSESIGLDLEKTSRLFSIRHPETNS